MSATERFPVFLLNQALEVEEQTGLTPRQLADQRAELLAALEMAQTWIREAKISAGCKLPSENTELQMRAAIASAKEKQL